MTAHRNPTTRSTHTAVTYGAFLIQPVVTTAENGRYAATAIVAAPDGSERVIGVDGDFALHDEASDRAVELAMAWIDQRRMASDHHVSGR
ncbi:hypothetical protein [Paraburkholderia kururiensis]|uniref:Uncharacterized protein n=1 Tax=Paraburkholderia kururiensis TaxID=984307 RepID=A0ABZ0WJV9_9BURK|nr:hypothetical protein [Paraburkholderia kururiensis]WQD77651.1 hypothetical protein U0042_27005 [Paraburkholderia kururiensis]